QEYERSHQKTNKANNEGRELIIALPNEWQNLSETELSYRMNILAQKILPNKYEYQWAIHLNKKETNLHAHLIFSERSRSFSSVSKWDRDVYLTNDGKVARRKADRAVDENGNVKPPVHRKGEPKSDGKVQFTAKDTRYKSSNWLEQVKQDVIEFYKEYGVSVDKQGLLHQYHEGKGSESAVIHAKNERISLVNEMVDVGQRMGIVFPERSSQRFKRMLAEVTNLSSPVSFYHLAKYAAKRPDIYPVKFPIQKVVDVVCSKLKENNMPFWLEKDEDSNMTTVFMSGSGREYISSLFKKPAQQLPSEHNSAITSQTRPQQSPLVPPKIDIENIVRLKHEYVRQCCILHYLKSCHTSCNAQNTYINAQNALKEFKKCSVYLINANDEYQRTFNPFKKSKLRKELDKIINEFESLARCLGNTLSLSVSYDTKTFDTDDRNRILAKTTAPLAEIKKSADNEIRSNKKIDELRAMNITDTSTGDALRAFQTVCNNVPEQDRQEVYTALKNTPTPRFSFEQQETFSRGRLISSENVSKVLAKLAPPNPTVQEREHTQQQQHKPIRRGR
ncbi:MAG: hypothetical protein K2H26_03645, partial [Ruminococcus sp.]|nr:hypothetical protein [Ruminococcus sp.]